MKYKTGCRELDWRIPFNRRSVPDEDLIYQILAVVEEIPEGRVATYGQIARLIGRERNAKTGGKSVVHGGTLWGISLPSSG